MGKPLISDAQMLSLHQTMVRLQTARHAASRSSAARASTWPVAVLAAALLQLGTEDVLMTEGEQPWAQMVLAQGKELSFRPDSLPCTVQSAERNSIAVLAAGYALAQNHYSHPDDTAPVTLAVLQPGTPVEEAMRLAGEHVLPLILMLREEPNRPRQTMTAPENVEIVQVDAEDAVAVCRVMQESMVRTRNRWGSVVLRAVTLPGSIDPVKALESHLQRRGLLK